MMYFLAWVAGFCVAGVGVEKVWVDDVGVDAEGNRAGGRCGSCNHSLITLVRSPLPKYRNTSSTILHAIDTPPRPSVRS